jgi:hypothetical protein
MSAMSSSNLQSPLTSLASASRGTGELEAKMAASSRASPARKTTSNANQLIAALDDERSAAPLRRAFARSARPREGGRACGDELVHARCSRKADGLSCYFAQKPPRLSGGFEVR